MWKDSIIRTLLISLLFSVIVNAQTEQAKTDSVGLSDSVFVMKKSPTGAMIRSALLPGWGQIYNESYWKAPVIWAIEGFLAYNWFISDNLYNDYKTLYSNSLATYPNGIVQYKQYREIYRDQRDLFAFYMVLTYFLNLVDAYVDAQLFDFQYLFDRNTNGHNFNIRIKLR